MTLRCLLYGHAFALNFGTPRTLRLRCMDCGAITDGWQIERPRYRYTTPDWPIWWRVAEWFKRKEAA